MEIDTNAKWPEGAGVEKWPFRWMDVNQTISFRAGIFEWRKIQARAHSYANSQKMIFRTRYDKEIGTGYVQRVM